MVSIGSAVFALYVLYVTVTNTQTYRHTDIQTTLRVTSVAIGRIYAMRAMWRENSINH